MIDQPRIRVLVADHDRWARLSVSNTLREAGFAVNQASNGMAALRLAAADPPQIVLIGRDLPEITAADVVLALRNDPRMRHIPVVHIRDSAGSEAAGGGRLDVDGRLELPCNPVALLATLLHALEAMPASARAPTQSRAEDTSAPKRARAGLGPSRPRVAPTLASAR